MRVVIVGLGIQGRKRLAVAGSEVIATIDPVSLGADYRALEQVPLDSFDAALLCIPDAPKIEMITYLLKNHKHVLVEKPLFSANTAQLEMLRELSLANKVACYTAYNHRFEPHFVNMKRLINSGKLGRIYSVKMFYGNGTARLVRDSEWRDQGPGVLPDLGSHLLDTMLFWFGRVDEDFSVYTANCFENKAPDHVLFGSKSAMDIQMEVMLLSWRNNFYADIFAEKANVHIESLCKWGPSQLIYRERQLPSGRPIENNVTLLQPDPTWALEYEYFKKLCKTGKNNINNDVWINNVLTKLCFDVTRNYKKV